MRKHNISFSSVIDALTQRIKELAERYDNPMPKLQTEVEILSKRVEAHLAKMGFRVNNKGSGESEYSE